MRTEQNHPSLLSIRTKTVVAMVGFLGGGTIDANFIQSKTSESIAEALRTPTKEKILAAFLFGGLELGTKGVTGGCALELFRAAGRTIKDRTNWW
jgi:hypothetical protein